MEQIIKTISVNPDSHELGTSGDRIKYYFNSNDLEDAKIRAENAIKVAIFAKKRKEELEGE